ncbi:C-type lectin domain family 6 member A-like [Clarias gariepinus]|uniref:C-type lectin domain family 6 member A-like n=1 Tax=Clarias gariepinus TaxID=13013 RepID=UPI00234CCC22|nr:C-type lectin domain family 6 member A-like [Clarias gariepinus]XP_053345874.1 C-type lectin domain family 6 member A-like [Clarias gariepinus]
MDHSVNYHSATEKEDGVYLTTPNWHPNPRNYTGIIVLSQLKGKKVKIIVAAFGLLLMLGALMALCTVGIFFHNKTVSFAKLREQYDNATATIIMQKIQAKEKERAYEMLKVKYQELDFACSTKRTESTGQCEEGWKSLGLKCYFFSTEKLNWTQSRDYCVEQKGGHLVIITNQIEQNFVALQIGETYWIGLNDLETEGEWMWVNSQSLNETGVSFWFSAPEGPNEPDNWKVEDPSGENCASLGHEHGYTHKWFDATCRKRKLFICEK